MAKNAEESYIIHTINLVSDDSSHRTNPVDTSRQRFQFTVSDNTALTKTGVHFCRVAPNNISTVLHWHSHEDEWFFIVEAAEDAVLLYRDVDKHGEDAPREERKITKGDFVGVPAGKKLAHALSSGSGELVYLLGGSRESLDTLHYPESRQRGVLSRDETGENSFWMVTENNVMKVE